MALTKSLERIQAGHRGSGRRRGGSPASLTSLVSQKMAFDEQLAIQVRAKVARKTGIVEKKMFGGLAFLLHGNMAVGIHGKELIVRLPSEETEAALREPGARLFDITGRPMKGWLLIGAPGLKKDESLSKWIARGIDYASSLPKKG